MHKAYLFFVLDFLVLPPLIIEVEGKRFTHPLGDVGGKLRLKFVHETFRRFPVENKSIFKLTESETQENLGHEIGKSFKKLPNLIF